MSRKKIATNILLLLTLVLDILNTVSAETAASKRMCGIAAFALVVYFAIEIPEAIKYGRK